MSGFGRQGWSAGAQLGTRMDAQYPQFGRPNWGQFRALMDNLGGSYAQDFFIYSLDLGAINAGATAMGQINIETNSAFDLIMLAGGANTNANNALTQDFSLDFTLTDAASARNLMNSAIPMVNMLGGGNFPFVLPITRRFMPGTQITITANSSSLATNLTDAQIHLIGRKLFMDAMPGLAQDMPPRFNGWQDRQTGRCYTEDLFFYDWTLASIASAAKTSVTTLIQADSDFEWIMTTASACLFTGGVQSVPSDPSNLPITVQVRDQGAGRDLFSAPIPISSIAGSSAGNAAGDAIGGITPFVLPQPRIFLAKTPVTVTFNNLGASTYNLPHFTMIGRKIFEQS